MQQRGAPLPKLNILVDGITTNARAIYQCMRPGVDPAQLITLTQSATGLSIQPVEDFKNLLSKPEHTIVLLRQDYVNIIEGKNNIVSTWCMCTVEELRYREAHPFTDADIPF
jgi:hypothetical protein